MNDPVANARLVCYITPHFLKSEPPGSGHFQPRQGASTHRRTRVTAATGVTDRVGIKPRVVRSRVQHLNYWAINLPERPSHLCLAGSLHKHVCECLANVPIKHDNGDMLERFDPFVQQLTLWSDFAVIFGILWHLNLFMVMVSRLTMTSVFFPDSKAMRDCLLCHSLISGTILWHCFCQVHCHWVYSKKLLQGITATVN